jgi:hypothetical protein
LAKLPTIRTGKEIGKQNLLEGIDKQNRRKVRRKP